MLTGGFAIGHGLDDQRRPARNVTAGKNAGMRSRAAIATGFDETFGCKLDTRTGSFCFWFSLITQRRDKNIDLEPELSAGNSYQTGSRGVTRFFPVGFDTFETGQFALFADSAVTIDMMRKLTLLASAMSTSCRAAGISRKLRR